MTTNITLELSAEVAESLTKLAEEAQLSVSELAEAILTSYIAEPVEREEVDLELELTPEEIAELDASVTEANKPDAKWYTQEEIDQRLERRAQERQARKRTGVA